MKTVFRIFGFYIALFALAAVFSTFTPPAQDSVTLDDHIPGRAHLATEDHPELDCYESGNLVCGDPDNVHADKAWQAWDDKEGWRQLKVDPNRPFKVEYVGTAMLSPTLAPGWVAIPSHGGWYIFKAQYSE